MPDFTRLYLDTTILRKSNWPHVSAELGFLAELARNFGIDVLIPESVEVERRVQWTRDVTTASQKCGSAMDKLSTVLTAIGVQPPPFPRHNPKDLTAIYESQSDRAKTANGFKTIPITTRGVPEFLELAVERTPPFQLSGDKVTGFQDAIILFSIIDDAKAAGTKACAILSDDDVFSKAGNVTQSECVIVRHFRSVEEFWKLIAHEIAPHVLDLWRQQKEEIRAALESQITAIQELIETKITPEMIGYRPKKIVSLHRPTIIEVEIPFPHIPSQPGPYETLDGATFRVSVKATLLFETLSLPGLSEALLWAFRQPTAQETGESQALHDELRPDTVMKTAQLEANATYAEGQYKIQDLEFVRIE